MRGRAVKLESGLLGSIDVMSGWVPWMRENSRTVDVNAKA